MAVFGKNILENLTTGMYSDSRVMYREYVQNSCDAIDAAVSAGIISRAKTSVDIRGYPGINYLCVISTKSYKKQGIRRI